MKAAGLCPALMALVAVVDGSGGSVGVVLRAAAVAGATDAAWL